jgi:FkbM family methyltransferase
MYDLAKILQVENNVSYSLSNVAIGDQVGSLEFYISSSDSSSSLVKGFRPAKSIVKVPVDTVDNIYFQIAKRHEYDDILMIIDVETAEPSVLRGGEKFINAFKPIIVCEVLARRNEDELSGIFSALGYVFYQYNGNSWIRSSKLCGDPAWIHRDWLFVPLCSISRLELILNQMKTFRVDYVF